MPVLNTGPNAGGVGTEVCAPWADEADACAPCADYTFDPGLLVDGIDVASDILFNLTGRRWAGVCTDEIRPPSACGCVTRGPWWGTPWTDGLCGCGCGGVSELILPGYPVVDVVEVVIDGATVDPARYRIDDNQRLVYQPDLVDLSARRSWPCCQRLSRPAGEEGTWTVTYTWGADPPLGGVKAAASLGCQLALACLPADDPAAKQCRLPKRVTSIVRQGVTLAIIDPLTLFADGLTGITEVDMWIASTRLGAARRRGHIWIPGKARSRRATG